MLRSKTTPWEYLERGEWEIKRQKTGLSSWPLFRNVKYILIPGMAWKARYRISRLNRSSTMKLFLISKGTVETIITEDSIRRPMRSSRRQPVNTKRRRDM